MNSTDFTHVVLIERPGPPDILSYQKIALPHLNADEVLIEQKAIGVNYVDVFFRNGTFPFPAYPAPIGLEAAGVVIAVGSSVTGFAIGDRIAYYGTPGAYAEKKIMKADELFRLPDDISFEQAASIMVKGLTAHMLLKQSHAVQPGQVILIHAMMGGVGTLLGHWARSLGAHVIGTVGSAAKKELANQQGFTEVIDLSTENFTDVVKEITQSKGLDAVYDGSGKDTFERSLSLIKPGGTAVLYGWPSGMPEVDQQTLQERGIRFVSAVLNNYPYYQDKRGGAVLELFDLLRAGIIPAVKPTIYPLREAARAHADLEARKTTGSLILKP